MAVPVPNPFRRLGILRPSADVPDADESTRVAIRVRPRDEERKLEDLGASLRKMASTLPHLTKLLDDADFTVRAKALEALESIQETLKKQNEWRERNAGRSGKRD